MTQFTCKGVKQINNLLNTFTIRISRRFLSAREFQMGNFQKYWSQNVGQDFIVLDFFVGGRSCGRKRCKREINVSRAGDPVHAGDKALTRETPTKRGRVNRYVTIIIKVQQALSPHDRAYGFQIDMGRSSNYGRNSNILIPDPYH